MKLTELAASINPEQTVLLLGAGASIPSGAPTGAKLARHLAEKLSPPPEGDDLAEIAGIFENRLGRKDLAIAVKRRLRDLEPTGGILALPTYKWKGIYTTNFDRLVETAFRSAGVSLDVVRSNFDFSTTTGSAAATLFKIHGCVSQDVGLGDRARMVLTELDYDDVRQYRQSLFLSLQMSMMNSNTLVVGQSLRDHHLRELAKEIGELRTQGVQGRVFLLVYEYDEDRARLLDQRGIEVVQGTLDDLMHHLQSAQPDAACISAEDDQSLTTLPPSLATTTTKVAHAVALAPDPLRLYNGSPATYADIQAGLTIERSNEPRLRQLQQGLRGFFLVLAGAAGVGKTSLARRLLHFRHGEGFLAFEHLNNFPLDVDGWVGFEKQLRANNRQGMLLVDDCAQHLSSVSRLVDILGTRDRPFLRIIVTVNAAQWKTRVKSPYFFSRGTFERLSLLADSDIRELINLVDRKPEIRSLVEPDFLNLGHQDKVRRLRERCSAEMYVCLKNIFQTDQLDDILLREFADLDDDAQHVYRYVAAVQSMGGKVHRQLIMRLLGIAPNGLADLLERMADIVSEYDISERKGLYGWAARHDVIAQVISTYKFADQEELRILLDRLIEGLNPTEYLELETARGIAGNDMGIPRLTNREHQRDLMRKLIATVPGERTPRRRLIRMFLDENMLDEADRAIRSSQEEIGTDNIVERYRATLTLRRALNSGGLMEEDLLAMMLEAERIARSCTTRWPHDRYNFRVLADVGIALADRFSRVDVLDDTISLMREIEIDNPDPDFARDRRDLESTRRRYSN
ncbi:SIR2 family protein [Mycobacterium sp. UM_Kg27]|uniref:SIR2 family NAD-dependent protein deacylase n=1 Tax=Mycobacterium sp. UM_Kg27 TaxID=1545693 RepID=UPI00061AC7DD|nr:SIR2 family protein [Mycobacterium sp. UM_Kg27]